MSVMKTSLRHVRELLPIFVVAVGVALASTLAGSVLDRVHQVNAEELATRVVPAVATDDGRQVMTIPEWGVRITLPLAAELPLLTYALHADSSAGLSSADATKLGPNCNAIHNTLGYLSRRPEGSYAATPQSGPTRYFLTTIDHYEYTYQMPLTACSNTASGQALVNRETATIFEALSTLEPIEP